jgi:hypothetical protein
MPGFWQIDTVHHCGQTTGGEYNLTLTATDVYSGWINLCALLNKAYKWTFEALAGIKNNAPFPILEFHSDNGSEFICRFAPFAYGNDYNTAIRWLRHQPRH